MSPLNVVRQLHGAPGTAGRRRALELGRVAGEGAEDPARAAAPRTRRRRRARSACRGPANDARAPAKFAAVTARPAPGREVGAGAGRLQEVRRVALLLDGLVVGGGDEHDALARRRTSIASTIGLRRAAGAVAAEAHVDRVGAAVGGLHDRARDRAVAEVALDDQQLAVQPGADAADAVVARRAGQRGDVRAVAVLVARRRAVAGDVVVVDRVVDLALQVGVAAVDAGVDDGDGRAVAARDVPGGGQAAARDPPRRRSCRPACRARSPARCSAGSLGMKRSVRAALDVDASARRAGGAGCARAPTARRRRPGRTLTRSICGTCAPSRRTPCGASTRGGAARAPTRAGGRRA